MVFKLLRKKVFLAIATYLIFISCEDASYEKKRALTIYQESQASWVRNFNPLTPAGSARWPTSSGIYEPLFIYNSLNNIIFQRFVHYFLLIC